MTTTTRRSIQLKLQQAKRALLDAAIELEKVRQEITGLDAVDMDVKIGGTD